MPSRTSADIGDESAQTVPRALRIGLLWHSASSGNLGVGALTLANMALIRRVAARHGIDAQFTIIGMRDGEVSSYVPPDAAKVFVVDTRSLLSPGGCWATIGRQDCVLDIGAGDSFAEIYGFKRFFFLWFSKLIAILRRRPLILSPQTIGPFTRAPYMQMAKVVLERSQAVVARDDMSLRALEGLAPRARGRLSVDVAFALPYVDNSASRGGARLRVGVNISGLLFNEAQAGSNRFGLSYDYARLMRELVGRLCARPDVEVHLVTHAISHTMPHDDDARVADEIHVEFPATVRVPTFEGPCEAKSYISGLDLLVAARMHACIAGLSSGVPVVPIAYSRKFSGLFGMLDYNWLLPVIGLDQVGALAYIEQAVERRGELAADAARSMTHVNDLLSVYEKELDSLMFILKGVR